MRHEGLDPRTRRLRWGVFLAAVVTALAVTGPGAIASAQVWLGQEQDKLAWYGIRLFGMLSYLALTLSVLYGLMLSTGLLDAIAHRVVSFTLHQDLAAIGLSLAFVHGALLTIDSTMPMSPVALLVPFDTAYRPIWVGAGQIALYLMAITYFSFSVRRRIGQRGWRLLHYTTILAFIGASAHGVMSGTDTPAAWALWMYATSVATVAFLFVYRVITAIGGRGRHRTRPALARAPLPPGVDPGFVPFIGRPESSVAVDQERISRPA